MSELLLVDANSLMHRAYHALPLTLTNSQGEPVNAVYGFATMLLDVLLRFTPTYVACAFDSKTPTFRHKEFKDYKAHRPQTDEDLGKQFKYAKKLLKALNIPVLEAPGFEADDIIGTLASKYQNNKHIKRILILTNDKDLFQLVTDKTHIVAPVKHFKVLKIIDSNGVKESLGITPQQVVDYKALVGDPSDNIPGVRGIGPKTAADLLTKYNTLQSIYQHLNDIRRRKPSIVRKLEDNKDSAFLSQELATIKTDLPIKIDLTAAKLAEFSYPEAYNFLVNMQFKSLIPKLSKLYVKLTGKEPSLDSTTNTPISLTAYTESQTLMPLNLPNLTKILTYSNRNAPILAIFTKDKIIYSKNLNTTAQKTINSINKLLVQDLGGRLNQEHPFTPVNMTESRLPTITIFAYGLLNALAAVTQNTSTEQAQDIIKQLIKNLTPPIFDIQLVAYTLITGRSSYNLEDLTMMYLNLNSPQDKLLDALLEIARIQSEELHKLRQLNKISHILSMIIDPFVALATIEMHTNGICLDTNRVRQYAHELATKLSQLEQQIQESAGFEFNVRSTKQLANVLFNILNLKPVKKSKTGYSTDIETLLELKGTHKIIDLILEYRKLQKIYSTYVKPFLSPIKSASNGHSSAQQQPTLINTSRPTCLRIHSEFNPIKTSTGRLASSNPNLQNLPIRTQEGARIREFFTPTKGHKFISLDYSQIDLRVLAHTSQDTNLINAFIEDRDIHRETASKIFNKPYEDITKVERRIAKTINFGIVYGMSAYGLSRTLGIDYHDAQAFLDAYFAQFPKVREYISKVEEFVIKHGYVLSLLGRRRYITGITSHNSNRRQAALREAINMPIQGGSDDIMRLAIKNIYTNFDPIRTRKVRLVLQIHDELIFEVPDKGEEHLNQTAQTLAHIMQNVLKYPQEFAVPLKVEYKIKNSL